MFTLILTTALLAGQPEAMAAQKLAGDAFQAAGTLQRAVEPAYQACRFKGGAATGAYTFWLQTHAPSAAIQANLNSGNALLAEAGGLRDQAIARMSEGTSLYSAGGVAFLAGNWIPATDFFTEAVGKYNEAATRWVDCCGKSDEANNKYQEVIEATR